MASKVENRQRCLDELQSTLAQRSSSKTPSFRHATDLAVFVVANGPPAFAAGVDDWPSFLQARARTAPITESRSRTRSWPDKGPPVLWKIEVGSGFSGPIVVGKRLVLHHRVEDDERIDFVDTETGKLERKLTYPTKFADIFGNGGPCATPCAADGKVVALGPEGKLTTCPTPGRRHRSSGRADLVDEAYKVPQSYFGVGSSPLIHDGRVLVNVGGPKAGSRRSRARNDGKELWKATAVTGPAIRRRSSSKVLPGKRAGDLLHAERAARAR